MKSVFQLHAKGPSVAFDGIHTEFTTTVFTTREKAASRIEKFRGALTDPKRLHAMQPDGLEIKIIELEIIE